MTQNKKFLIVLGLVALFFMLSGGWLVEKFRRDPIKKEFKAAKKELKVLRDSIKAEKAKNTQKLNLNKKKYGDVKKNYKEAADVEHTDMQLDSLRAEFKRKTGS